MKGLTSNINREIPIAPLVTFRVLFGLVMLASIIRFATNGWIEQLYLEPEFFFTYAGFDWIRPLGATGMYVLFFLMSAGATGIALGWRYRITAPLFFTTFTYVELIDKTNYLNHYYFVSIVAFLLILVPAHRYFSLDVWRRPETKLKKVPAWTINIFKLQLGLVYFFAGIAKINPDWLFRAMPLKIWLAGKTNIPIIGNLFNYSWAAYLLSWAGMLYDMCVPFLLLNKRLRPYAYLLVIVFHIFTSILFNIGMFPFIMILATLIFFPAAFHQKLIDQCRKLLFKIHGKWLTPQSYPITITNRYSSSFVIPVILIFHFAVQVALPMRYVLYPGNLFWTEQGYRFSWRVMLMEKAGVAQFTVRDSHGRYELVDNSEFLTPYQEKMMSSQPDMIHQFAQYISDRYQQRGFIDPEVTVDAHVTLNGRRSALIIDPDTDLAATVYRPGHNHWITNGPHE